MLSEKLTMEEKIKAICKKDRTLFQKGAVFDKITVLNSDPYDSMLCGPVTFLGCTDRYEILFTSYKVWYNRVKKGGTQNE